ncbi:MAG: hypothetical protein V4737_01340, partial [Curtobacterium sp.]
LEDADGSPIGDVAANIAALVVGTAGNPALLDALDRFLAMEEQNERVIGVRANPYAVKMAEAILAGVAGPLQSAGASA